MVVLDGECWAKLSVMSDDGTHGARVHWGGTWMHDGQDLVAGMDICRGEKL
jgi:hypothetical protein